MINSDKKKITIFCIRWWPGYPDRQVIECWVCTTTVFYKLSLFQIQWQNNPGRLSCSLVLFLVWAKVNQTSLISSFTQLFLGSNGWIIIKISNGPKKFVKCYNIINIHLHFLNSIEARKYDYSQNVYCIKRYSSLRRLLVYTICA